jgi:RNA polymerase sigma-70 factor (ECF subfamily)
MPRDQKQTFEELAVPHFDALYRIARRLARDEHAAEDLLQETYLKAYAGFSRFQMREFGIKPWLLKILHNTFLNRLSRGGRNPRSADPNLLEEVESGANGPLGEVRGLDFELLDGEVRAAIDALQPEYRTVLLLWATMELSYQEIADILGVPVGTVMSRLHRARQSMLAALAGYARENRLSTAEERP